LGTSSSIDEHWGIKISGAPVAAEELAAQKQQLEYVARLEKSFMRFPNWLEADSVLNWTRHTTARRSLGRSACNRGKSL
jgi:hypothetical protein